MRKFITLRFLLFATVLSLFAVSCKDDNSVSPSGVTASFQFEVDADVFNKVQFTNFSIHFASVSWNFGDGTALSAEENPLHTFAEAGKYTVTLTATGSDKVTSQKAIDVTISDPNIELKKLTGETSKTWKLIRDVSTGVYPLQVGPTDRTAIWWASGLNEDITVRPCLFNDEYIFSLEGKKFEYKTNGDLWKDTDVWATGGCADTSDPDTFKNKNGDDITAWGDGVHTFDYNSSTKKLSVIGQGAFLGLCKVINGGDGVLVPQASVTYDVKKLVDDVVDTLIVEATFPNNGTPGYWRFVLVHYDNPALEPSLGTAKPTADFSTAVADKQVTFTNSSSEGTYAWDFGDGQTSTETNPVHTFASEGFYIVKLTVSAGGQSATRGRYFFITPSTLTNAALNGGSSRTWKLAPVAGAFGVGDYKGGDDYWPNGSDISGDRPCLFNDEFIFKTGDVYQYDAKSDMFREAYWNSGADGCADESTIAGDASIWKSGNHTYSFTAASGDTPASITVSGLGAFIALPKAYNGGEYSAAPTTDNPVTYEVVNFADSGTSQAMQITVDIGGGTFWSFILVSQ